jgi:molybdopterin converting factor small subunit
MVMKVKIKYGGLFSELTKKEGEELILDGESLNVSQLIAKLFNTYIDLAKFFENSPTKIFEYSMIFVNNKIVNPNEMSSTRLSGDDLVMFMPVVTGG